MLAAGLSIVSSAAYEPYGLTFAGATPTIGFTGYLNAADIGLVYMQQRYYDPVAGRFLSIDPVVTDANTGSSFNRYAYANNNPYEYVDPDGRNAITNLVKQTIKHDGNVVKAAGDVIADVVTVVSPSSTPLDRLEAAISLVSPVDVSDVKAVKNFLDKAGAAKESGKAFSKGKQALVEMAKEDKKAGISPGDMQAYKDLNKDLPEPFPSSKVRGPEAHGSGAPSSREPHGHVGPVNHIPVKEPLTMNSLKDWLIRAGTKLGVKIEPEFVWRASNGQILRPLVRIPDIGAPNGMLIFDNYDEVRACVDEIIHSGYGYSVLDQPRPDEKFELTAFREMFADWGLDVNE